MGHLLQALQMVNDMENLRRPHQDVVHLHRYLYREHRLDVLDVLQNRDELRRDDCLTLVGVRRDE